MKNMAAQLAEHRARVQQTLALQEQITKSNEQAAYLRWLASPAGQAAEQRRLEKEKRDKEAAELKAKVDAWIAKKDKMRAEGVKVGTKLKITEAMKPFIHRMSDRLCYKLCLAGNASKFEEPYWTLSDNPKLFGLVVYHNEAVYEGDCLEVTHKSKKSIMVMRYNPDRTPQLLEV